MKKASYVLSFLLLIIIIALAIKPSVYIDACWQGLIVWASVLLPSLFPFLFFTKILTSLGVIDVITGKFTLFPKLMKTPPISAYTYVISILSGYIVGAKVIADLYEGGFINKKDAYKMSTFSINSGPMFVLGSVGIGMLASKTIGLIMLFSHILGAFINGIVFRNYKVNEKSSRQAQILNIKHPSSLNLGEIMWNSISAILIIGGFVCIFFVIIEILNNLYLIEPLSAFLHSITGIDVGIFTALINGFFETTHGCMDVSLLNLSPITATCLCTALITFGGLATMFQAFAFLQKTGMTMRFYIFQKLINTLISTAICFLLCLIFL